MALISLYEKALNKFSESNLKLAFFAEMLIFLTLGSIYSIKLVKYGIFILMLALLFFFHNFMLQVRDWKKKKKITTRNIVYWESGTVLLFLILGIQATFIPFKKYILGLAIILLLFSLRDFLKK